MAGEKGWRPRAWSEQRTPISAERGLSLANSLASLRTQVVFSRESLWSLNMGALLVWFVADPSQCLVPTGHLRSCAG